MYEKRGVRRGGGGAPSGGLRAVKVISSEKKGKREGNASPTGKMEREPGSTGKCGGIHRNL